MYSSSTATLLAKLNSTQEASSAFSPKKVLKTLSISLSLYITCTVFLIFTSCALLYSPAGFVVSQFELFCVAASTPHRNKKMFSTLFFFLFYILVYLWFMTARSAEKKTPRVSPIFHGLTVCVVYYSSSMISGREKPSGKESTSKESAVAQSFMPSSVSLFFLFQAEKQALLFTSSYTSQSGFLISLQDISERDPTCHGRPSSAIKMCRSDLC